MHDHSPFGMPTTPNTFQTIESQKQYYFNKNSSHTAKALFLYFILSFGASPFVGVFSFLGNPLILIIITLLVSMLPMILPAILCMKKTSVNIKGLFSGCRPSAKLFGATVIFIFGAQFAGRIISALINAFFYSLTGYEPAGFELTLNNDVSLAIMYGILICIVAPLAEEFLFRGAILKSLSRYGTLFAVLVSAILFSLFHANFDQIPFAFFAGLVFGYLTVKTGSIIYSILLHAINNTVAFGLTVFDEFYHGSDALIDKIAIIFFIFTILCAVLSLTFFFTAHRKRVATVSALPFSEHDSTLKTTPSATWLSDDLNSRKTDNIIKIKNPYLKYFSRPAVIILLLILIGTTIFTALEPWLLDALLSFY